jgi:hypothetical protein
MRFLRKPKKTAVILNDTSYEFHHGCESVITNIKKLLWRQKIEVTATNPVNRDWRQNRTFRKKMAVADLVLVNGEGSLHHAKPRAARLITVAEYIRQNQRIPVVLINATCQENGPELTAKMKNFTRIYVRESLSQKELEDHSIPSQVVPDMSFYTYYDLDAKRNIDKIGVTDSVYPEVSEYLYNLSLQRGYLYLPILADIKLTKDNSNLFPFVYYHLVKKLDLIRFKTGSKLKHKKIKRFFFLKDYRQYIQAIAELRFLITGRFHSLCFALKTLTPFIAIPSNSHKMEALIQDIGLDGERLQTIDRLKDTTFNDFSPAERNNIQKYVTSAPSRIEQMFEEIKELTWERSGV